MSFESKLSRESADRAAQALYDNPRDEQTLELLNGLHKETSKKTKVSSEMIRASFVQYFAAQDSTIRIGPLESRIVDGETYFYNVRFENGNKNPKMSSTEASFWADLDKVPQKSNKKRIVFIGESVAFGLFYAPVFTPARALQEILNSSAAKDDFEVINLTRIDMVESQIVDTAQLAIQHLSPDLIITFAGNNWHSSRLLPPLNDVSYSKILREEGVEGLFAARKSEYEIQVRTLVDNISSAIDTSQTPWIYVLPDFCFGDWCDFENEVWLSGNKTPTWRTLKKQALDHLHKGEIESALNLATKMLGMDKGLNSLSYYILAECAILQDRTEDARRFIQNAWEVFVLRPAPSTTPRKYNVIDKVLREHAAQNTFHLVDLPKVFDEECSGQLPGHQLFIDYCHMTSKGTNIAMAATAAKVYEVLYDKPVDRHTLLKHAPALSASVEARTLVLASIISNVNSNNAEKKQRVTNKAYLERALRLDSNVRQHLERIATFNSYYAPYWTVKDYDALVAFSADSYGNSFLDGVLNNKGMFNLLASSLGETVLELLKETDTGEETTKDYEQFLLKQYSLEHGSTNLLDPRYCAISLQEKGWRWSKPEFHAQLKDFCNPYCFFKGFEDSSRFIFVCDGPIPVYLHFTYRMPAYVPLESSLQVEVNGNKIISLQASHTWRTEKIAIPSKNIISPLNRIVIRWPSSLVLDFSSDSIVETNAANIEDGKYPDLFPVFGEIHSFYASNERFEEDQALSSCYRSL